MINSMTMIRNRYQILFDIEDNKGAKMLVNQYKKSIMLLNFKPISVMITNFLSA